jgi:predicted secreted protein
MPRLTKLLVLAAALLVGACAPLTLTARDNGRAVQLGLDKKFKLILEANPSTGYHWEVVTLDQAVVEQGESLVLAPEVGSGPPVVGAPVTMVWTFRTLAPGHTPLRLAYRPSAPQPGAAEQTWSADITVLR